MGSEYTSAHELFDDIVKGAVTPILKPLGFRKTALNFYRRHKDTVQVINLQSSSGSYWQEKLFYINVGIAFDAICQFAQLEILEKPRYYFCSERGMNQRLEILIPAAPSTWSVKFDCDPEPVARQLQDVIEMLTTELQEVDSIQTYCNHRWFACCSGAQRAQIYYILDDLDASWNEVKELSLFFADRPPLDRAEWWIKDLGLLKLGMRLECEDSISP
jgi:hypothetical protein